ncbi:hypothetical protein [Nostoc sp. NMS4]|uniref:hypothetical protein n=1 Tax=Nostoc sp. NMS4 TaxID=2815390 RepID=UPI0025CC166C|nr:hypothetical protein [Nostoc sp. NMS4]MBN3927726.1 hypothetical protein [Nostoc sp. NMS4]
MINNTKILYDEKVKSLAEKYESQGFRVVFKPKTDKLPFNLGNYQPDIIAIRDGSGLVIEVKTNLSRVSVDRLQALAEEVSKHQGWRFLLVTLEDIEAKSLPGTSEQLPSWQDLADRFHEAHRLIESDEIEQAFKAAFLLLWSTFEGALRKRAVDVSIPIERFPVIGLLKHMYSLGELSISQFDFAQFCFEAWNSLAHGYIGTPYCVNVLEFDNLVGELLDEWRTDSPEESWFDSSLELAKDLIKEKQLKKELDDEQVIKVESAVSKLLPEDLAAFRAWFAELDAATGDKRLELTRNLINQKSNLIALELTRDLIINEKNEKQLKKELDDEQVINVEFDVSQLSPENLAAFHAWFAEFDAAAWDKQIEKDVAEGRLDVLAEKALKHLREGRCTDL